MNLTRVWHVFWLDFKFHVRRPLFIVLLLILGLTAFGLSKGGVSISAGDAAVGGKRAWLTSEHSNAFSLALLTALYFGFFVSVAAGLAITSDDENKVGEVLHATPLRPHEYIWGKFLAVMAAFTLALLAQLAMTAFFLHVLPNPDADKVIGPFAVMNYLRPALVFALPMILFVAGVSFALGEYTRKPILVFFFPVALLLFLIFFLWDWSPSWLDPALNKALMLADPSGFRWLNEAVLKVDRGVDYYNTQPVELDGGFLASRLAFVGLALGAVLACQRHFTRNLRGAHKVDGRAAAGAGTNAPVAKGHLETEPLAGLGMTQSSPGWLAQMVTVARFEFSGLAASPGMYLFVPLILLQSIPAAYYRNGPFGTFVMVTAGNYAAGLVNVLTLCVSLLLLFYTVESLARERGTGTWPLVHASPMRASAWLTGKVLANTFVAAVVLSAAFLGFLVLLAIQGNGRVELFPFAAVWGMVLAPTFLVWTSWVVLLFALTRNKLTTYALALVTMVAMGWAQSRGWINWVTNWNLWGVARWSDLGFLEPNATAIVLNRALWVGMAALFIATTVRIFERREFDPTRTLHRMEGRLLLGHLLRLAPFAVAPLVLAIVLGVMITRGTESKRLEKKGREYWRQNVATWADKPVPTFISAEADLRLDPGMNAFHLKGAYVLENIDEEPMRQVAITLGHHIDKAEWTLDGVAYTPENRTNLFVFTPAKPLAKGERVTVGFEYGARYPGGINRNGGGMGEFILPSGVVIQGWSPTVFPVLGFVDGIGVKGGENDAEPRVFPEDYHKGEVTSAFGSRRPFTTRIRVDVPEAYQANSNGELVDEKVADGRRVVTWATDHPIMMFNVVAGKWKVRRGEGTAVYYHAGHEYNIDEMMAGLDGARKYYSEWFYPYPWKDLKLSQFANLAGYAQGFATNITFSESIGFLTRSTARGRAAFTVAAHEAAHQWWGNTLVPGDGPGGNILSEGMAHYSTILLSEAVKGLEARIEFCKRIEESYGESRVVDSERPMVRILGDKPGDTTVQYDKGGMVFWMQMHLMGREAYLEGIRAFIGKWHDSADHPLLEDFVEDMRPFAKDKEAYDAFVRQWFFEVVAPAYKVSELKREQVDGKWVVTGTITNTGTGRMPVEVAALSRKERFVEQTEAEAAKGPAAVRDDYRDARTTVTLGAGESAAFRIESDFEPKHVTVDPDVLVLMLNRKKVLTDL